MGKTGSEIVFYITEERRSIPQLQIKKSKQHGNENNEIKYISLVPIINGDKIILDFIQVDYKVGLRNSKERALEAICSVNLLVVFVAPSLIIWYPVWWYFWPSFETFVLDNFLLIFSSSVFISLDAYFLPWLGRSKCWNEVSENKFSENKFCTFCNGFVVYWKTRKWTRQRRITARPQALDIFRNMILFQILKTCHARKNTSLKDNHYSFGRKKMNCVSNLYSLIFFNISLRKYSMYGTSNLDRKHFFK